MKVSGSLPSYKNSLYDLNFVINDPASGFNVHLVESGTYAHMVSFSGQQGYLFDQSGRYFNGYQSGTTFNLKVFYDYSNRTFTFYHDDVLVANSYDVTGFSQGGGFINTVVFDKEDTSSLSVDVSGITT